MNQLVIVLQHDLTGTKIVCHWCFSTHIMGSIRYWVLLSVHYSIQLFAWFASRVCQWFFDSAHRGLPSAIDPILMMRAVELARKIRKREVCIFVSLSLFQSPYHSMYNPCQSLKQFNCVSNDRYCATLNCLLPECCFIFLCQKSRVSPYQNTELLWAIVNLNALKYVGNSVTVVLKSSIVRSNLILFQYHIQPKLQFYG